MSRTSRCLQSQALRANVPGYMAFEDPTVGPFRVGETMQIEDADYSVCANLALPQSPLSRRNQIRIVVCGAVLFAIAASKLWRTDSNPPVAVALGDPERPVAMDAPEPDSAPSAEPKPEPAGIATPTTNPPSAVVDPGSQPSRSTATSKTETGKSPQNRVSQRLASAEQFAVELQFTSRSVIEVGPSYQSLTLASVLSHVRGVIGLFRPRGCFCC